ncbi:hypothetical protein PPERSA_00271 [Pseudocohnilembus persalinus]|uniref:Uncharacterized protein n=1 Tax=Pseudocohnilembus persalinus TaxID=266149 RepID=A0A0V0Q935_PSEPJ|nr:hypothetical protein PPERSA_00271 [Pseudocohnilembus persalinus]|eukprot:KRW98683.1 hypothetical protein PPERSA_00271 [Pseudocohnilembus persalinus]
MQDEFSNDNIEQILNFLNTIYLGLQQKSQQQEIYIDAGLNKNDKMELEVENQEENKNQFYISSQNENKLGSQLQNTQLKEDNKILNIFISQQAQSLLFDVLQENIIVLQYEFLQDYLKFILKNGEISKKSQVFQFFEKYLDQDQEQLNFKKFFEFLSPILFQICDSDIKEKEDVDFKNLGVNVVSKIIFTYGEQCMEKVTRNLKREQKQIKRNLEKYQFLKKTKQYQKQKQNEKQQQLDFYSMYYKSQQNQLEQMNNLIPKAYNIYYKNLEKQKKSQIEDEI